MNLLLLATPKHTSLFSAVVICNKMVKAILIIDVLTWLTCPRCNDSGL